MDGNTVAVILEELRSLRTEMNSRFERVDERFADMDQRFDQVDQRFDALDQSRAEDRHATLESLAALDRRIDQLQELSDRQFDQIHQRFIALERSRARGPSRHHRVPGRAGQALRPPRRTDGALDHASQGPA